MNPDMIRMAKERLELALQALEMGDADRCGRLALSVGEMIGASAVPPELADWPTWSNPAAWGHISESMHV